MKCKICGAELRKDGDICSKCYAEYVKEEEIKEDLEKDKNIIFKIHRKYIPLYQLTRYGDYYVLTIIIIFALLSQYHYFLTIMSSILMLIILCIVLAYNKSKAINTTCTFLDKRVVWKYKDKIKTMDYLNIDDVCFYQNFFQKRFNLADVQFRPKKGNYITNGFEIKNVSDFDQTWKKICDIVISKRDS